ncbi:hypothetical protein HN018_06885 [Lichenicola cladoniae]|uniref:Uncharacterized protein n=1 Tax=Lichenicola cladoniae TaxID=1484109 RepID=A0A6M8HNB9_9PROT|nr:hypothetical protein [Lichenicola cladoniae]NPD67298.1 hypothetical protein [Acetobacteraceae bacterium]QKE89801.1 hypothetical protein HN018_06885 [Lichenicola cladoniae]
MTLDEIIAQLKTYAPVFNGNVAGAAEWELAGDQVWLPAPAAYVVQIEDEPGPNLDQTGLQQIVTQTIGIIVDLDNSIDRRGQAASTDAVGQIRTAVFGAILNWRPGSANAARGFAYARGGYLRSNRARLIWQFDFAIETTITEHDGFQVPFEPLVEVQGTITNQPTGTTLSVFDAAVPQS